MRITKIINKITGERLIAIKGDDVEYVNPIKYYRDYIVASQMILRGVPQDEIDGKVKPSTLSKEIFIESMQAWYEKLKEIKGLVIPDNLRTLLTSFKKQEQKNLLKSVVLTPSLLIALIFDAYTTHGFLFSEYKSEIPQKGIDLTKMPYAYEFIDNDFKVYGKTEYSSGQLKQALKHRKVMIAKFLDRDEHWHCFFTSFKSIGGEEMWLGENQPHYHYISSSFGITRKSVLKELKSREYKLGNLPHIKLEDYGNQPVRG